MVCIYCAMILLMGGGGGGGGGEVNKHNPSKGGNPKQFNRKQVVLAKV